ncbi:hypothetical protein JTB14_013931 [Gonioctena quinquepunctata]|nr:hypothetical protein JTB14_013931 [Gonioctena quinquepunctata]
MSNTKPRGADSSLKPVVKCLWMRYLEKLEVIYLDYDDKPKLPIVNVKRDFKILYDIKKKRKRRKSSSDESTVTNSTSTRRERTKKKRELAQAQYEEFSQKSNQESTSLHNETLGSIKSSSDRSVNANNKIRYNRYCIKELRKKMSQRHYEKHKLDHLNELNCHKFTYKDCSKSHQLGVHFLSPIKLYCTLYLGLLIIKDKIQLGDLLRFIREGHLSFNNYTQLFPENYTDKFLNIRNNCKNVLFSNRQFRVVAAKLAKFLEVTIYIGVPDLVELGRRYCQEMNLPDEIFLAVKNLLSKIHVKLKMTKKGDVIPNYEGRIMSLIIFTLKLLFGLDGETENHLSST